MKWKNRGHEFEKLAQAIYENHGKKNKYYIWGAGTFGIAFYELFSDKINIAGFIDSKAEKQGTKVNGLTVYSPEYLIENRGCVLVSAGWTRDIFGELKKMGYKRNENCFHIDEFTSVYNYYKDQKVYLSDITYCITQCCTLHCKNCASFIPLIKKPQHIPFKIIKEDFEQFFKWTDKVNVLGLVGGDAMLHPQFNEILEFLGETYYPEKAVHLEVYTNAVIIPSEKTLELMKKYDVFYRFTDYRPYTESRQNIEEVEKLLKKYEIRYDHVKFEKWLDCGYPQVSNGVEGEDALQAFFEMCDRKSCHGLYKKQVMYCSMGMNAEWAGYCDRDQSDVFDISRYDPERKAEYLEFMLGYSEKGYLEYCKKCNGSFNVNSKYISAGEQL